MLIIFDLDGVLIDSELLAAEAMSTVLGSFGHDVPPKDIMHTYTGLSLKDILAKVEERLAKVLPAEVAEGSGQPRGNSLQIGWHRCRA